MLRSLAPSVLLAGVIFMSAFVAFALGGPAWLLHLGVLLAAFAAAPAVARWDESRHGRRPH